MSVTVKHYTIGEVKHYTMGANGVVQLAKPAHLQINQIFFLNGYGQCPQSHDRRAVYEIEQTKFGATYKWVNLDKPQKGKDQASLIKPAGELFGIGLYYHPGRFADPDEIANALQAANQAEVREQARRDSVQMRREQSRQRGKALFGKHMPEGTKAVIVAQLLRDDSDPMTDYFHVSTQRRVILAFSSHDRTLFPELRKAAERFEQTRHLGRGKGLYWVEAQGDEYDFGRRTLSHNGQSEFPTLAEATAAEAELSAQYGDLTKVVGADDRIEHRDNHRHGSILGRDTWSGWIVRKVKMRDFADLYEAAGSEGGFLAAPQSEPRQQAPAETETAQSEPAAGLQISDYSEKAFVVTGETKAVKDTLKALGGRFNARLGCGPGWVFSKSRLDEVRRAFGLGMESRVPDAEPQSEPEPQAPAPVETPEENPVPEQSEPTAVANYQAKRDARIERYRRLAQSFKQQSNAAHSRSKAMFDCIPMGQPILVGHHSERRDRNFRDRIWRTMGKSVELQRKADYYNQKAETAQSNDAISSDDPQALDRLREKLADLENRQRFMRDCNKVLKTTRLGEAQKREKLAQAGIKPALVDELLKPGCSGGSGFAGYQLSNNNANIKRVKERIEQLEDMARRQSVEAEINGVRILQNVGQNRVQLFFEGKRADTIRALLKSHGFRWAPSEGAWQRQISNNAVYWANEIARQCAK